MDAIRTRFADAAGDFGQGSSGRLVSESQDHWKIDAGNHLNARVAEKHRSDIRRRASKHIGQEEHSAVVRYADNRALELRSRNINIVMPVDGRVRNVGNRPDDHFRRSDELTGEVTVSNYHASDYGF